MIANGAESGCFILGGGLGLAPQLAASFAQLGLNPNPPIG